MRVDADDFARPCSCGREHQIAVKEILIEAGAVEKLEEEMSEGMLREYISRWSSAIPIPMQQQKNLWRISMTGVRYLFWMQRDFRQTGMQ